jgi:hypothetical protein
MKDLIGNGLRAMVPDDLADALLDYAVALYDRGSVGVVRVPALVGGNVSVLQLLLAPGTPIVAVSVDSQLAPEVDGAEEAAWELRHRTAILRRGAGGEARNETGYSA